MKTDMTSKKEHIPIHVSILMDGNGRWAQARGLERVYGHFEGVESVRACTEAALEEGVQYLSLYAFSEENWDRPQKEVSTLMNLMVEVMLKEMDNFMENGIRFVVLGNRERLDEGLKRTIDETMERTKDNKTLTLIVFLSYSGKWDILQAVVNMAKDAFRKENPEQALENYTIDDFSKYLVTKNIPDPDLIIRTSGEKRLSNYLLWQGAYSELLFVDTLWPDFRKKEFRNALEAYTKRDRRYGKVK